MRRASLNRAILTGAELEGVRVTSLDWFETLRKQGPGSFDFDVWAVVEIVELGIPTFRLKRVEQAEPPEKL